MSHPDTFRVAFPGGTAAAGQARGELQARLLGVLDRDRLGDLQLLVTEIVANSVRHGGVGEDGEIELRVLVRPDAVRVELRDTGVQADPRVRAPDLAGGGGFGMVLVESMSQRWGVDHEPRAGQTPRVVMWFELGRGLAADATAVVTEVAAARVEAVAPPTVARARRPADGPSARVDPRAAAAF